LRNVLHRLLGTGVVVAAIAFAAILHDNYLGRGAFEALGEVDEFGGDFVAIREFFKEMASGGDEFEVLFGGGLRGVAADTGEESDDTGEGVVDDEPA
jgi:hypothetical protein